jgi:serine/threonine protein phosphatase PrpC
VTGQPFDIVTLPRAAGGRARGGRPIQQDELACLYDPREDTRLLVLADGMGGDGAGELAARGVVQTARKLWEQGDWRNQPGALFLEAFCQAAHDELRRLGRALKHGEPHSTVVALLMRGDRANWAHVGDSRLYRFRGRRLL